MEGLTSPARASSSCGDAEEIIDTDANAATITEVDMTAVMDRRTLRSLHDEGERLGWFFSC